MHIIKDENTTHYLTNEAVLEAVRDYFVKHKEKVGGDIQITIRDMATDNHAILQYTREELRDMCPDKLADMIKTIVYPEGWREIVEIVEIAPDGSEIYRLRD